jgi:glycine hydroxymethyltransferase
MSASIARSHDFNKGLYTSLAEEDPEIQQLIDEETYRQFTGASKSPSFDASCRAAEPAARTRAHRL